MVFGRRHAKRPILEDIIIIHLTICQMKGHFKVLLWCLFNVVGLVFQKF